MILVYHWKAYNYRDILTTFEQLGYEICLVEQELQNYDMDEAFAEHLDTLLAQEETQWEFVFSVNYFALIAEVCHQRQIPYVMWNCDSPMISMYHKSVFYPTNYLFLFDLSSVEEFREMGVDHVYHLPLAVSVESLDAMLGKSETQTDADRVMQKIANARGLGQRDEISFVGNLYDKNSYDALEMTMPDHLRGYFEALMEAQRDLYGVNIIERMLTPDILEELSEIYDFQPSSEDSLSDLGLVFSVTALGFKIAQLQRKSILMKLSKKHTVGLYSNNTTQDLYRVCYRGSVNYWEEMPFVFSNSPINLNMTIPNIKTGIPLRSFDVMGAGGFLLSNYQIEYPMFFELDREVVCYYCEEDLLEKADFYLKHEEERKKIARRGYERVKTDHTYIERMRKICNILKEENVL